MEHLVHFQIFQGFQFFFFAVGSFESEFSQGPHTVLGDVS